MKLSSRHTYLFGLTILLLGGLSIIFNHQGFALRLLSFSFWVFILATAQYIWEMKKNAK